MASTVRLGVNDEKFFRNALFCDQIRGRDSTGMFVVPKAINGEVDIYKRAYPASDFIQLETTKDLINKAHRFKAMVGHNRAATKGAVNHWNAHPFQHGDITLVHNGTLRVYDDLPGYSKKAVDSELLCRAIDELGVEEAIGRIRGAYALIWHDASDDTLNFLRNDERPLSIASSANRKDVYFASEGKMLEWLCAREKINLKECELLKSNMHLRLDLSGNEFKPTLKKVEMAPFFYFPPAKKNEPKKSTKELKKAAKKRDAATEKKKKDMGVEIPKIGEISEAWMYDFTPYKNSKWGYMSGISSEEPYFIVEFHNQDPDWFNEGLYGYKVCHVRWDETSEDFVVRGIGGGLIEEEELSEAKKSLNVLLASKNKMMKKTIDTTQSSGKTTSKECSTATTEFKPGMKVTFHQAPEEGIFTIDFISEKGEIWLVEDILPYQVEDLEVFTEKKSQKVYVRGPSNAMVSEKMWNHLTKHGCSNCSCNLVMEDSEFITWRDTTTPVCGACEAELDYGKEDNVKMH